MKTFITKKARNGIELLSGMTVSLSNGIINVKNGAKSIDLNVDKNCQLKTENNKCFVFNTESSMHAGTDFSNLNNVVAGLKEPFKVVLMVKGSGYKVLINSDNLVLSVAFSHTVQVSIPKGVSVVHDTSKKSTGKESLVCLVLTSHSKNDVTKFASQLESIRFPNVYKGSGIKIEGKYYVTKKSAKGGK